MMNGAGGHFDFAVWPKGREADIFDLWAANLVLAILPRIDSGPGQKGHHGMTAKVRRGEGG
jgi:hypothetical protein